MIRSSTTQLQRLFAREWNDPSSDVRAALSWCDLSHAEREWRAIIWKVGGREELEMVSRAACVLESERHEDGSLTLHIAAHRPGQRRPPSPAYASFASFPTRWRPSPDHRLPRLSKRLTERNQGFFDSPHGARDDWRLPWTHYHPLQSRFSGATITIEINPPTHHEHLEAALFLREWLTEHAPDLLPDWFPGAS